MSAGARLDILTRANRARVGEPEPFAREAVPPSSRPHGDILEQFASFAAEYHAHVHRVAGARLPGAIRDILTERGSARVVVPADLPGAWLPGQLQVWRDAGLSALELDAFQAVVTGCAVAIAETGTVVLDHAGGQGRRALTLIPDHHVCVVREEQVVESVPRAVAALRASVLAGRPLTWISGPSATSDIELSRVEGVHGPRVLDILLVSSPVGA